MEFSRQEYWSGLPLLSPGDLPNPGIQPRSPTLQADSLPSQIYICVCVCVYIHTHTHIQSFSDSFPIREHWVELPVLYNKSLLVIYFIYSSVCILLHLTLTSRVGIAQPILELRALLLRMMNCLSVSELKCNELLPHPCDTKRSLLIKSIGITWELIRNAEPGPQPRPTASQAALLQGPQVRWTCLKVGGAPLWVPEIFWLEFHGGLLKYTKARVPFLLLNASLIGLGCDLSIRIFQSFLGGSNMQLS